MAHSIGTATTKPFHCDCVGRGTVRFTAGLIHVVRGILRIALNTLSFSVLGRLFNCFAFRAGACDFLVGVHHFKMLKDRVTRGNKRDTTNLALASFSATVFKSEIYPNVSNRNESLDMLWGGLFIPPQEPLPD